MPLEVVVVDVADVGMPVDRHRVGPLGARARRQVGGDERHLPVQKGDGAIEVAAQIVGLQRRRTQQVGREERSRLAGHADLLVVAEHALPATDRRRAARLTMDAGDRAHDRAALGVQEILAVAVEGEHRRAIGQAVAAGVERQHDQLRRAARAERDAALAFDDRLDLVDRQRRRDVEVNVLVERSED